MTEHCGLRFVAIIMLHRQCLNFINDEKYLYNLACYAKKLLKLGTALAL